MNHVTEAIAATPPSVFTLLAALIALLGAFAIQRYVAFRAASVKFRASVLKALVGLYPIPVNWPNHGNAVDRVLQSAFPELQSVVAEFRDALPKRKLGAFDRSWQEYRGEYSHYYHYMGYASPDEDIPDSKDLFHTNVTRLLSFAKEA